MPKNVKNKKRKKKTYNFSSGKQFVEQWLSFIAWIKSQLHILGVLRGKLKERKWEYLCHSSICISSQAVYNVIKSLVPVLATLFGLISYRVVRTACDWDPALVVMWVHVLRSHRDMRHDKWRWQYNLVVNFSAVRGPAVGTQQDVLKTHHMMNHTR